MVRVNGKNFNIHPGETLDNIIQRLAKNMHTLPRYIYFPNGMPSLSDFYLDNNFIVENLLERIKKIAQDSEVQELFDKINPKLAQQNLSFVTDVLEPFIVYNKYLINLVKENAVNFGLLFITTQLEAYTPIITGDKLNEIWEDRDKILAKISQAIAKNSARVDRAEEDYLSLAEAAKKHWVYTEFELERVNFEVHFNVPNLSVVELFNYIQLTHYVPFSCINNIYKILKDFVPQKEWAYQDCLDDIIIFRVLQRKELVDAKLEDYVNVIVDVRGESPNELVVIDIALDINKQNLSQEDFMRNFLQVLKIDISQPLNIQENSVKGVFYFPHHMLNKYILADLILNNPHFSNVLAIDESSRATKRKDSVYVHFYNESIGHLTANITQKIAEKGDPILKDKDTQETFKYGSYYIRVKISKADNQEAVNHFQDLLSTLLAIYTEEEPILLALYRTLLKNPTFGEIVLPKSQAPAKKLRLGEIAPEVFVKGYPPKCTHQPTIISNDQVVQAESEGKKVLVYPRTAEEGFPQRNYICEHKTAIYPGLRDNPLSNKDLVPYLPCCYELDHNTMAGKPYRKYYYDDAYLEAEEKVTVQQDFIITYKLARHNVFGKLLDNLDKLFGIINKKENFELVRKGVFYSPSSFLECVLEGLADEGTPAEFNIFNPEFNTENERIAFLNNIRTNIGQSLANVSSCRQELYDYNLAEIQAQIQNPNIYLDPHLFINLLEVYFDCNIYVFSRPQHIKQTELILPRHLQSYYQTPKKGKCVLIYEHWGSKSDHSSYPHCELIVEWEKTNAENVEYSFANNSPIHEAVQNLFSQLRQSYALNNKIPLTIFPTLDLEFIGQGIDAYGKCRMLQFNYQDNIGTLLLSPIQPLAVRELINWTLTPISANLALDLANYLNLEIIVQNVVHHKAKSYSGFLGNVKVTIPILEENPLDSLSIQQGGLNYVEQENSILTNYNNYKKLARYITSYVFWLYSVFLHQQNETISLDSMQKFREQYIAIEPNFIYGKVSKVFSMESGVMLHNKLIVKSEETLKRLMYSLRVFALQEDKLLTYYMRKVIDNYYADVTDFDTYPGQVILQGEYAVDNWILHQKQNYYLYNTIQFSSSSPYFFKNKLIGEEVWLAQNTFDINKAIIIAQTWLTQYYNPGEDPDEETLATPKPSFSLYSYKNSTSIAKHIIGDSSQADSIKIIGYKIEGDSFFTVLLPL